MAYVSEIKDNAIVLDYPESGEFINVNKLADQLVDFLEYLTKPDIIVLKHDKKALKEKLETKFPKFVQNNFGIYDKIVGCEDISLLFDMLEGILQVQSGSRSKEDIEKLIGNKLNKKFVHTKS